VYTSFVSTTLRVEDVYMTPEKYLAAEHVSETKHEYLAGVVYAMAGGTRQHGRITNNIVIALGAQLFGKPCFPFGPDVRVRIRHEGATFYYYPDVAIDCSGSRSDEIETPTGIFEVLSPSTDRADRGDKLVNYQSIPSVAFYGLVEQQRPLVTVHRRAAAHAWEVELYSGFEQVIPLPEIGCMLSMADIYREVFPEGAFT
jgi:Uma2 family endonuclease